jgi:hypothetical protein
MSRAVLMIALHESLGRLPTPEEKQRFLESVIRQAGGERIYIAHRQLHGDEIAEEVQRLHLCKWSLRRIAGAVGCSKDTVRRMLSQTQP